MTRSIRFHCPSIQHQTQHAKIPAEERTDRQLSLDLVNDLLGWNLWVFDYNTRIHGKISRQAQTKGQHSSIA